MNDDRSLVYALDADTATDRDPIAQAMVKTFLEAHGIDPMLFVVGNQIRVFRLADGSFQLETWRTFDGWPLCESCPSCIRQERVVMPLAAPVPAVPGSLLLGFDGPLPDIAKPDDAEAAAEAAYRVALEEQSRALERANDLVCRRRDELQGVRAGRGVQG